MAVISSNAEISAIRAAEQGSNPSTPAAGYRLIYAKSDGWYDIDDAGNVSGPLAASDAGITKIAETIVGVGGAANIDFTSIPGTYRHLIIEFQGRSDRAGQVFEGVDIRFNNDSGSNYDSYDSQLSGPAPVTVSGTESFGATSGFVAAITGASAAAGLAGVYRIEIPNYAGTAFNKQYFSHGHVKFGVASTNLKVVTNVGDWRSSSAITRITLIPRNGSNFIEGTTATLYGLAA